MTDQSWSGIGEYGKAIGVVNRERVRRWLLAHVGGTRRECAKALGLSEMAVGRHVSALRAEWRQNNMLDK